jgi:hypothetical protein
MRLSVAASEEERVAGKTLEFSLLFVRLADNEHCQPSAVWKGLLNSVCEEGNFA